MAKPGPKARPPNLQAIIRKKALHAKPPSDEDIQHLLVSLLYDVPDDTEGNARRAEVKLKILLGLHQINKDNKPVETATGDIDNDLLQLLAARAAKKKA